MTAAATWRRWTAALLVISALLFGAALLAEGGESAEATHSEASESGQAPELGAQAEENEEAGEEPQPDNEAAEGEGEIDETLFGVDLENPFIVWGFVIVSLALAAAVFANVRYALIGALALGVVAALLDGREVLLQLAENNAGIAVLAAATAVAHVAVAILAVLAWRVDPSKPQAART